MSAPYPRAPVNPNDTYSPKTPQISEKLFQFVH
jgi:hypothetical protein